MIGTEYQAKAKRTECNQAVARNRMKALVTGKPLPVHLNHAVLGLAGEVGGLSTILEHWVYYGQELDEVNLKEELGDCLWYIAEACNAMGYNLSDIMEANILKLKKRYPEKFAEDISVEENRDREAEAEAVEETCKTPTEEPPINLSYLESPVVRNAHEAYKHAVYNNCQDGSCCEGVPFHSVDTAEGKEIEGKRYSASYSGACNRCNKPIHKNNSSGLCPDCYAKENPQA